MGVGDEVGWEECGNEKTKGITSEAKVISIFYTC